MNAYIGIGAVGVNERSEILFLLVKQKKIKRNSSVFIEEP